MVKVIGICGFQGAGKDTLANIFVEKYGYKKLSFASIVKDVCASIFSWDREMLEGATKESRIEREKVDYWWAKKLNISMFTPRYALQFIGTELFRNGFHKDIWLLAIERQIFKYDKVVISDCRFPNEINMLRSLENSTIIHITRNLPSWFELYYNTGNFEFIPANLHTSEWEWIVPGCIDCTIENNYDTIDGLINYIELNSRDII